MFAAAALSALLGWGAISAAPPPAPASTTPAPCVCVCQGAPESPTTTTAARGAPAAGEPIDLAPRDASQAAPPAPTSPPPPSPGAAGGDADGHGGWYGGPAIFADGASMALMLGGGSANDAGIFSLGIAGFALGAPINHLAHGQPLRALASFGVRALATGAGAFILLEDVLVNHCDNDVVKCRDPAVAVAGASLVVAAAMIVDDALIARAPTALTPAHDALAPTLTPGVFVGPGLALASLGGRF
jgi:hypothetical protein